MSTGQPTPEDVVDRILTYRVEFRMTNTDIAELVGVSNATVGRILFREGLEPAGERVTERRDVCSKNLHDMDVYGAPSWRHMRGMWRPQGRWCMACRAAPVEISPEEARRRVVGYMARHLARDRPLTPEQQRWYDEQTAKEKVS